MGGLLETVFDGNATRFVGTSTRRSVLSETEGGREVLVTSGTRMCTQCRAGGLARGGVGGLKWDVGTSVKWNS